MPIHTHAYLSTYFEKGIYPLPIALTRLRLLPPSSPLAPPPHGSEAFRSELDKDYNSRQPSHVVAEVPNLGSLV